MPSCTRRILYCTRRVYLYGDQHASVNARVFTHFTQNYSTFRRYPSSRPQLSFLSESNASHRQDFLATRSLTTDQKEEIKYQIRLGIYWAVMGWSCVGAVMLTFYIFRDDWLSRKYPCPRDWSFTFGHIWRIAENEMDNEFPEIIDWNIVLVSYLALTVGVERGGMFESLSVPLPTNTDIDWNTPGLDRTALEAEPLLPHYQISKIGPDISEKSEEWRRAYFKAQMGLARASERLHDHVVDTTQKIIFPKEQVIGPSNPFPKPFQTTIQGAKPPHEENCKPCTEPPELLYQRMLTSRGFSRRQLIKIGLAYAAWLDYIGRNETASELCRWSLSLACEGVSNPSKIVNIETGLINSQAPFVTANILEAVTALAAHEARNGNIPTALNIYTSVLRARQDAPDAPAEKQYKPPGPDLSLRSMESIAGWLKSLPTHAKMEKEPPSGDEPFERSITQNCKEAALMAYVGEIMFGRTIENSAHQPDVSSSQFPNRNLPAGNYLSTQKFSQSTFTQLNDKAKTQARDSGIAWTRKAVEMAEEGYMDQKLDPKALTRCMQCLEVGLENWHRMVKYLAAEEVLAAGEGAKPNGERNAEASKSENVGKGAFQWLSYWGSQPNETLARNKGRWKKEEEVVAARKTKFAQERLMARLNKEIKLRSDMFVI